MQLGADVTVMLRGERALMTGAGEYVEPLPGEKPPLIVVPLDAALGAGEVYREFDAHDTPRTPEELDAAAEASRQGVYEPVNDLEPAARRLCPPIDDALRALREVGRRATRWSPAPARPCSGSARTRRRSPSSSARTRGPLRVKFTWLLAAVVVAGWLIVRRHKQHRWVQVAEVIVIVGALLVGFGIDARCRTSSTCSRTRDRRSASGPTSPSG